MFGGSKPGKVSNPFIEEAVRRYPLLDACRAAMEAGLKTLEEAFARGGKMLVCGNGGSAADAEHIVGELIKGFLLPRTMAEAERQAASHRQVVQSHGVFVSSCQWRERRMSPPTSRISATRPSPMMVAPETSLTLR